MYKALFVDTGNIIALVNENDRYHTRSLYLSKQYDGYRLVTTEAILLEVGNALAKFARKQASSIIKEFQTATESTLVRLNPVLFDLALQWYDKYQDKTWGLVDCISFAVMQEMDLPCALAFDQHCIQAGFQLA